MSAVYCETTLNYTRGEDPEPLAVSIRNGREALPELDFADCCFTLLKHQSKVTDWQDADQLSKFNEAETAALAQQLSGCDITIPYTSLVRSPSAAETHTDYAPIQFVHTDYTDDFLTMVKDPDHTYSNFLGPLLQAHGLSYDDVKQASRVAMMQFWRNTGDPRPDYPLAVCDASSVSEEQLGRYRVAEYAGEALDFETYFLNAEVSAEKNRWYAFPGMATDELIAFRAYDSDYVEQHKPFWTFHTAFKDPLAGEQAPQRSSVENRVLCLWR